MIFVDSGCLDCLLQIGGDQYHDDAVAIYNDLMQQRRTTFDHRLCD